jgi:hypothetical protein
MILESIKNLDKDLVTSETYKLVKDMSGSILSSIQVMLNNLKNILSSNDAHFLKRNRTTLCNTVCEKVAHLFVYITEYIWKEAELAR